MAGTCLARAPWADLSCLAPCLLSCRSPQPLPFHPRRALTRVRVLVPWGPWPALLAARLWW